jgi:hypothetical protein
MQPVQELIRKGGEVALRRAGLEPVCAEARVAEFKQARTTLDTLRPLQQATERRLSVFALESVHREDRVALDALWDRRI